MRNVVVEYIFHFHFRFSVTWYGNSAILNSQTGVSISSNGTLNMASPQNGYYRCSANNIYGTAWSDVSWVRKLRLDPGSNAVPKNFQVAAGANLTLPCTIPSNAIIVPAVGYNWQTVVDTVNPDIRPVELDKRIQMKGDGKVFNHILLSFYKIFSSEWNFASYLVFTN